MTSLVLITLYLIITYLHGCTLQSGALCNENLHSLDAFQVLS